VTKAQLFNLCVYFLCLEQRALLERRPHIATWSRRMYEKYRARLDRVKAGEPDAVARSYRPARGLEPPEEVTTP